MRRPRTAVIVLWLDSIDDTLECLEDLAPLPTEAFTVVLVDNGSRPARVAEMVERRTPRENVLAVRSDVNLGFARGNAFGLRHIDLNAYDYVLLLNNDTAFEASALLDLVAVAVREGAGVAGPAIVYDERPEVVWQGGGSVLRPWLQLIVPAMNRPFASLPVEPQAVDFVTGCAMLVRTELIRNIGFLDEGYFYSVEDLDYCLRARAEGSTVLFVPGAVVRHKVSRTAGGWASRFAVRHNVWGKGRLIRRHLRGWRRLAAFAFHGLVALPVKWWRSDERSARRLAETYRAFYAGFTDRMLGP